MGKIIGGVIIGLIVIIAIVVGVFYFNLDKVIIAAVESYGSDVTKTDVVLNDVDLDLTSGKGALKGFSVGNPDGFEEDHSIKFDSVAMEVDIADTSDKLIHIREIRVENPSIIYEVNQTTNNLTAIQNNVDAFLKEKGLGGEKSDEASSEDGPKVIIDNLYVTGGQVSVKAPILANQKVEGRLPNIHMVNIGKDEGGASPGEVAAKIIEEITGKAMGVITQLGIGKNIGTLLDNAGDLVNKTGVGEAAGKAGEAATGAAKGATGAVEGAGKSIKKLFGD
ncbi:hypothetical protein GQF03_12295 [Sneathiella chungangensis]|uniref:AsmA domain-containing protein n=1 Tax=Sneathiella chungangensis TaxID=1418234 RepID=A0A845MGI3_9PROT|nr:hypothetical protein [Sneathiella chungangensis]MZR23108.1 hypothetical protein [Sneathiella chungangensis]